MPEVIKYVMPAYPSVAEGKQLTGKVWLAFQIAPDGSVIDVVVDKSQPAKVFDAAALAAGRQFKFNAADESHGQQAVRRVRVALYFESPETTSPAAAKADGAITRPADKG